MGLFDYIFGKRPKPNMQPQSSYQTFNAYQPVFRTYNGQIYENELVRAAIDARARNISKLNIVIKGVAKPKLRRKLQLQPNELQTWSQFLYRVSTILDLHNTCFIVPIFDVYGEVSGYYPVLPTSCALLEYQDRLWLKYQFQNGKSAAIEYDLCGVLTKFQYKDDFFGETNVALYPTMQLININNQAIQEGVKSAATYRFMAKMTNFVKPEDLVNERKRFSNENFKGESGGGLLLFPNTYGDIKQIESKPFVIDPQEMNQIKNNVFNYFGVNEKIIQNIATDDQLDAFFNGCIEPFCIQFSDTLTRMAYTERERTEGNKIMLVANRLQYMSVTHKVAMAQALSDRGILTIDEVRDLFNYPPLPDDVGKQVLARGEYYNIQENETDNTNQDQTEPESPKNNENEGNTKGENNNAS